MLVFCNPRVNLWDRPPRPEAKLLENAGALEAASRAARHGSLQGLDAAHVPAVLVHKVPVPSECLGEDYTATELLYFKDRYDYLIHHQFDAKFEVRPKIMRHLCRRSDDQHCPFTVIWNAFFLASL